MSSGKAKRHTHRYRLVHYGSENVWACGQADCNHYMPPHMTVMIEGKASECWDCNEKTIMSIDRMLYAIEKNDGKMLCDKCRDKKEGIERPYDEMESIPDIDAILAKMRATGRVE